MVRQVLIRNLGSTDAWVDISSTTVEDFPSLRDGFGSLGSSALDIGKLSVKFRVPTLTQAALYQTTQKQVRMLIDGIIEFEGYTVDASDIQIEERTDYVFIALHAYPYSKAFDQATLDADLVLKNVKVCDPSDTANSLVHLLFSELYENLPEPFATILAGSSPVAVAAVKTKTLPLVMINKGKNILNTINDLLYQNGLAFYMTKYTAIVIEPYQLGRTPSVVLPITSVVSSPSFTQKPYIVDQQCKLRFPTIETVAGEQVFKLNEEEAIVDVAPDAYYPEDGKLIVDYKTEKAENDDDIELVLVEDPVLTFDSASFTDYNSALYAKQSFIRLLNATAASLQLKNIWIHATAWYRKYKAFYLDSSLPENLSEKTVDGDYIPDKAEAENFLAVFKAELLAEKTSLVLKTDQSFAPNTLIQIEELPYYLLVRSRTRLLDGLGLFQYECVAYSFTSVIASTGNPVKTPPAVVEPARSISLFADSNVIAVSARNELKTQQIEITATLLNLPIADAVWACDDGTLSQIEIAEGVFDPYRRLLDCTTVEGEKAVVTVSIVHSGQTYSYSLGFPKFKEGLPTPMYLDAQSSVPTITTEGPLVVGDFFLYVGAYSGPNSDPGDQGLNPPALEINEFVYGRIYEYFGKNAEDEDQWKESRKSEHLAAAQKDALQIAKDSNTYMFVAVLVAQLGLFQDLLVEKELRSTNYASHMEGSGDTAKEVPDMGFKLNGRLGEILAYAMRAYEAEIFGNLTASGFKTLQEQAGRTIPVTSVTPTVWKHSEMEALIANQDSLATLSGTIDGYSFTKATRRLSQRILLASHGYEYEAISATERHDFTRLYPSQLFGRTFRCRYNGYYSGNFSMRTYQTNRHIAIYFNLDEMPTSYDRERTYTFEGADECFYVAHYSAAYFDFGAKPSYVNFHQVWTEPVFSGLVLVNGESSYRVIQFEPTAYYTTTKTWTIGSYNQNSIANYCSGTDFYNLFSALAIGADGFCDGGQINVNGTPYTVTRLIKGANSITFYTSGGVVVVNKFQEGTNIGVYTSLAVTQAINFQAVAGGIETKHIFPWGTQAGSPGSYDLGTSDARFNTLWLKILDVLNAVRFRSTLQVDGAATVASLSANGGISSDSNTTELINLKTSQLSKASSGYTRLPNGLLFQWGAGTGSISFPISFSTVYRVVCCPSSASTTSGTNNVYGGTYATSVTNSGFLALQWHNNGDSTVATSAAVFYVAIGV